MTTNVIIRPFRGSAPPAYSAVPAQFNGSSYLTRGSFTGQADSKLWTIAGWFKPGNDGVAEGLIYDFRSSSNGFTYFYHRVSGDYLQLRGCLAGDADTEILNMRSSDGVFVEGNWFWIGVSVNMANSAQRHMYKNDTNVFQSASTYTNALIDFTLDSPGWFVGANGLASARYTGGIADLWMALGVYIDFSVEANRRKFISATGKPVDLGLDGSNPIGVKPTLFLSGDIDDWHVNKGDGDGLTENDALTLGATSPSD